MLERQKSSIILKEFLKKSFTVWILGMRFFTSFRMTGKMQMTGRSIVVKAEILHFVQNDCTALEEILQSLRFFRMTKKIRTTKKIRMSIPKCFVVEEEMLRCAQSDRMPSSLSRLCEGSHFLINCFASICYEVKK